MFITSHHIGISNNCKITAIREKQQRNTILFGSSLNSDEITVTLIYIWIRKIWLYYPLASFSKAQLAKHCNRLTDCNSGLKSGFDSCTSALCSLEIDIYIYTAFISTSTACTKHRPKCCKNLTTSYAKQTTVLQQSANVVHM